MFPTPRQLTALFFLSCITASAYLRADIVAGPMLAHKAEEDGVAVAEWIAGKAGHVNWDLVPGVVHTDPEVASVGLGEDVAKAAGIAINVGKFNFAANGRALATDATEGFVKIIADVKAKKPDLIVFRLNSSDGRMNEKYMEAVNEASKDDKIDPRRLASGITDYRDLAARLHNDLDSLPCVTRRCALSVTLANWRTPLSPS